MPIDKIIVETSDSLSRLWQTKLEAIRVPTKEDEGRFYHVIISLSRTALKNYYMLRGALDANDQEHLAWACRNLLELNVFMKNILKSKDRLLEFAHYRHADGIQIVERLIKLEEKHQTEQGQQPGTSEINSNLRARLDEFNKARIADGVVSTKHLPTREWAEVVGLEDDYDIINKVCSKLVHPTSWSILTEDIGTERFPDAYELFYLFGTMYFAEMFNDLGEHMNKCGLSHTPKQ